MESYLYQPVKNNEDKSIVIWPFIKQLFICSSIIINFFITGLYMGSVTVMIAQMRREANSSEVITSETSSWLSSTPVISSVPWSLLLPLIAEQFGRKIALLLLNVNTLICNIIYYRSTTVSEIIISEIMQGMLFSSFTNVSIMILSEYTSPKYRGLLLAFKSATFYYGILIANAMGTYFHWKNIGIVIFGCCIYNFIIIFYPESPYWLASKKRFEECSKSHRWLKGIDENAESELEELIMSHQRSQINRPKKVILNKVYGTLTNKIFYKPVLYSLLTTCSYIFSGKLVYTIYAIDIIKKITDSEKMAYQGMLVLDGVSVFGMYVGSVFTKMFQRRTQLLSLASLGVTFLFALSLYLYLIRLNIISENKYISLSLLSGFSLSISCGPMILATCCFGELAPFKYRWSYLTLTSVLSNILIATFLKIAPNIFKAFEMHGAFMFYALTSSIVIYLLYRFLPETKDKTIQEIERSMAND